MGSYVLDSGNFIDVIVNLSALTSSLSSSGSSTLGKGRIISPPHIATPSPPSLSTSPFSLSPMEYSTPGLPSSSLTPLSSENFSNSFLFSSSTPLPLIDTSFHNQSSIISNSSFNQSINLLCGSDVTDEYQAFYETAQYVTGLIVYPVLCIIGIIGNILALVVLAHRDMRTSTNVYLSSLAVSDTIKLANDLMYFVIVAISQTRPDDGSRAMSLVYPLAHYVFNMSVCVTAWLTVSVAVERFISVCYASRAKELCTIKRARLVCTFVFISMSVLAVPSGLRYRMTTIFDPVQNITCVMTVPTELGNNEVFMVSYSWVQNSLRGLVPVFILVFLNARIVNELRKERVKGKKFSARNRITIMLLVIVFMFLVCITPDAIMSTFFGKGYVEEGNLVKGVREITDSLLAVNSALNFILYCAMSAVFRTTFIKIFCPSWISNQENDAILMKRRKTTEERGNNHKNCATGPGGVPSHYPSAVDATSCVINNTAGKYGSGGNHKDNNDDDGNDNNDDDLCGYVYMGDERAIGRVIVNGNGVNGDGNTTTTKLASLSVDCGGDSHANSNQFVRTNGCSNGSNVNMVSRSNGEEFL